LCQQFKVSRITVRRALDRLSNDGLISRTPRRGTVVRSKLADPRSGWKVDTIDDIVRFGQYASLRVLSYEPLQLCAGDAQILHDSRGFLLAGLRCMRRKAIGFTSILLPARIGAGFSREDFTSNTVFTLLMERLNVHIGEIRERVASCAATEALAAQLLCAEGSPLLHVERVYFDIKRRPVELARTWYLPGEFSIEHKIAVLTS
jgi:GntR family transcriptional regulator